MQFHVLGIGAVGSLLSYHLRRALPATHTISLIFNNRRYANDFRKQGGITMERNGISRQTEDFKLEYQRTSPSQTSESFDRIDSLFVTTKAYSVVSAIRNLQGRLSDKSTIVLFQNGMGIYEKLVQEVFRNPLHRPHFILASNTHGAFLKGIHNVVHTGVGEITFGIMSRHPQRNFEAGFYNENLPVEERTGNLDDLVTAEDPEFTKLRSLRNTVAALLLLEPLRPSWLPMARIQRVVRRKLAVNAIINPLTAIMNCRNGQVFQSDASKHLLRRTCAEISSLYAAEYREEARQYLIQEGATEEDVEQLYLERFPSDLSSENLVEEVLRVAQLTSGNFSSMLSDIRKGHQTEIRYINGYLLDRAKPLHIHMPNVRMLAQLVDMRTSIPLDNL